MSTKHDTRSFVTACLLAAVSLLPAGAVNAQTDAAPTLEEVRTEVAEAMEAIAAYSEAQREEAAAEARSAVDQLDAAVAARQREMRDAWAEMTEQAREDANARLAELQSALVDLAERVGTLQAGTDSAWEELSDGLMAAWGELSAAVSASLEPPAPEE
jgi:chromosome segregation ATPase